MHGCNMHWTPSPLIPIRMTFYLLSEYVSQDLRYLSAFLLGSKTHKDLNSISPDNFPEILKSTWNRSLSSKISSPNPILGNQEVSIEIIISRSCLRNLHPIPLIRPNIRIPILLSSFHCGRNRKLPLHPITRQNTFQSRFLS